MLYCNYKIKYVLFKRIIVAMQTNRLGLCYCPLPILCFETRKSYLKLFGWRYHVMILYEWLDNDDASPAPRSCINNLKAIAQGHEIGNGMWTMKNYYSTRLVCIFINDNGSSKADL